MVSRLELERRNKRLTTRELGELVGVSHQTILNIEGFKIVPKLDVALKLQKVTGIELVDLLSKDIQEEIAKSNSKSL